MSRPTDKDIATALGIDVRSVHQLRTRGMPCATIGKAREWFTRYGFKYHNSIHLARTK